MKLLLIGSDSTARRLHAFGVADADDATIVLTRISDLVGVTNPFEYQAAILDWDVPGEPAAAWLRALREIAGDLPVIVIANHSDDAKAREAGADEVIWKPVNADALRNHVRRVARAAASSVSRVTAADHDVQFLTHSAVMEKVLSVAWRVAPTHASVLLLGENGTGKTRLARAIHARSARASRPFLNVNCPCLQPRLLESELFGHVRGAFTGAVSDAMGKVAAAEGGTLFLDEIGELPLEIQAKLLRLVQERQYERVGEARTRTANIRLIAATNRDLKQQVAAGLFREDLYYRLNVISIEMPALRSRPEDIVPTAEFFLEGVCRQMGGRRRDLTLAAREALTAHAWPGNLRELRNAVERAAILCDREWLDAGDFADLTGHAGQEKTEVGEFVTLDAIIEAHIRRVTARAESYEQAARILGIDKSTLYRWRKRFVNAEPVADEAAFAG